MDRNDVRYKLRLLCSPFPPDTEEDPAWEHVVSMEEDEDKIKEAIADLVYEYVHDMDEYTEPCPLMFKMDLLTDKQVLEDY